MTISHAANLNLPKRVSHKLIAIAIASLLTTCKDSFSAEDEVEHTGKTTIRFPANSAEPVASTLEELASLPIVASGTPSTIKDNTLPDIAREGTLTDLDHYPTSRPSIFSDMTGSDLTWDEIQPVRILSLDGGGVRDIAEARFIKELSKQTGKSVPEMFHLVAGTSAGGILAGAYTLPEGQGDPKKSPALYSSDRVFEIIMRQTSSMFVKGWSFGGFLGPRYKSEPVDKFMNDYFGDATFDRTTTDVLVTTFDISASRPKLFKSWDTREIFYTRDVLKATSAAPTYFAPRHIYPVGTTAETHLGYTLSDGGTCANNPTLCALADARKLYPDAKHYQIVSLGTGNAPRPLHYGEMESAGLIGWGYHLIDIFMNGQSAHTDHVAATLLSPREYSRWNPVLAAKNVALDNTSDTNLRDIVQAEDDLIASRKSEFDQLAKRLAKPKADLIPVYSTKRS